MKIQLIVYSAIFIFFVATSCKKNETPAARQEVHFTTSQKAMLGSSNTFGLNLLSHLGATIPENGNLFISPLSVSLALTMTYNGASGNTAVEMKQVLGIPQLSQTDINQAGKDLLQLLLHLDPKVTLEIANSIWYRNTFPVKADFLAINTTYFDAEVNASDFNDPNMVNLINSWVKTKTHEKIQSILDNIDPAAVMYLINAVYFKGAWQYAFDPSKSSLQNFHLANGSTYTTSFMNQLCSLKYMKNELLSAVELPYANGYFSMVVMVPEEGQTTATILGQLTDKTWNAWNTAMTMIPKVQVLLPKFKTQSDLELKENLIAMGMKDAFLKDVADFSGIDGAKDLLISKVKHKTFVEVNEEGTEAAAVTSVEIIVTSVGPGNDKTIYFNADKPFVFFIKENTTNSILFAGVIQKPVVD